MKGIIDCLLLSGWSGSPRSARRPLPLNLSSSPSEAQMSSIALFRVNRNLQVIQTSYVVWWPPWVRGFVCAYHPAVPGSNPNNSPSNLFKFALLKLRLYFALD